jgi:hypothetical protein
MPSRHLQVIKPHLQVDVGTFDARCTADSFSSTDAEADAEILEVDEYSDEIKYKENEDPVTLLKRWVRLQVQH